MRKFTESLCQYLDRLKSERGEEASRSAIRSYGEAHGKKGLISIQDQIKALETVSASVPRPAVSAQPVVPPPAVASVAPSSAPRASVSPPELFGQDRVRASIRAGLQRARSGTTDSLHNTNFSESRPEVTQTSGAMNTLKGRDRLQKGIRMQLVQQGFTRSLAPQSKTAEASMSESTIPVESKSASPGQNVPPVQNCFPAELLGLTGKSLLQASIRGQLQEQNRDGSLPRVRLSPV